MKQSTPLIRFYALPRPYRRTLIHAAAAVTVSSITVALLPFKTAIGFGAIPLRARNDVTPESCVWAVEAVSRRLPWRPMCIQKGLAVQRLLRRGGIDAILHYGARRSGESGKLEAHVWVSVSGETVIGGEEAAGFGEIATFP